MAVDAGSAVGYLDLDISGFLAGLRNADEAAGKSSKTIAAKIGGHLSSAGESLTKAGTALTKGITVPIAGAGAAIISMSTKFESAMSRVQAISGASGKDLIALTNKAKELGATTEWSASEVADGMTEMAKAGWSTKQIIDGFALYPNDYFCPVNHDDHKLNKTKNTYTIHWFSGSWMPKKDKLKIKTYQFLKRILGEKNLKKIINKVKHRGENK